MSNSFSRMNELYMISSPETLDQRIPTCDILIRSSPTHQVPSKEHGGSTDLRQSLRGLSDECCDESDFAPARFSNSRIFKNYSPLAPTYPTRIVVSAIRRANC